jgi:hypothetical protein
MQRRLQPELLDHLPPDDPRAIHSRKDLQRLNAWMRHPSIMAAALRSAFDAQAPHGILDIGAGDGAFMLRAAENLGPDWNGSCATLLDQQNIVSQETLRAFEALGWHAHPLKTDVLDWLREPVCQPFDVMIANLFLHHFREAQLSELLRGAAKQVKVFVALEPRRSTWSLLFSRLAGIIGCNSVTRHDAVASVRAGFAGKELSRLWPADESWKLEERPALVSHLFIARRKTL